MAIKRKAVTSKDEENEEKKYGTEKRTRFYR